VVRVKICGITNVRDAEHAVSCGADAIGFIFAESPRRVDVRTAENIIQAVGPWVTTVGVFVNEKPEKILQIAKTCRLSAIQLHGDEKESDVRRLQGLKVIKAIRVAEKKDLAEVKNFRSAHAFLFDTKKTGVYGGTGHRFDWSILKGKRLSAPMILSGGLDPSNVNGAVKMLKPYGVDVSSCVEKRPGVKDFKKVEEFIRNAKRI
jgi:phosphoribosylanthranilate isomerase